MKDYSEYVGIVAGICTAASLCPQLFKIIRDKKAGEISYFMLFILLTGLAGWIWYGFLKTDYPILVTNMFSFLVNILIIIFTVKYKKRQQS
jgi:MtN3 and saliva related transmembrane protein